MFAAVISVRLTAATSRARFGDDIVRDGMGAEEQYVGSDILGGILDLFANECVAA